MWCHKDKYNYAPAMTMAGTLNITPVGPYIRLSVGMSHPRRPLSKLNSFDQNFMKLGHIVKYYNVFFKFDNGSYRTLPSGVMTLCL